MREYSRTSQVTDRHRQPWHVVAESCQTLPTRRVPEKPGGGSVDSLVRANVFHAALVPGRRPKTARKRKAAATRVGKVLTVAEKKGPKTLQPYLNIARTKSTTPQSNLMTNALPKYAPMGHARIKKSLFTLRMSLGPNETTQGRAGMDVNLKSGCDRRVHWSSPVMPPALHFVLTFLNPIESIRASWSATSKRRCQLWPSLWGCHAEREACYRVETGGPNHPRTSLHRSQKGVLAENKHARSVHRQWQTPDKKCRNPKSQF